MRKIKIYPKRIPTLFSVTLFSIYAYSQMSWSYLIPNQLWITLLLVVLFLMFLKKINNTGTKISLDIYAITAILMLLICLLWNNQIIARHGWKMEIPFTIIICFYLLSRGIDKWFKYAIIAMICAGFFYAFWTFVCNFDKNIYNGIVYPLMEAQGYVADYRAGFTASYGANGLYMSMGIVAYIGYFFFSGQCNINNRKLYIGLLILIIAMLLTGKRGQTIALMLSFYVLYYFYNSNKKFGRVFKLVSITLIICLIIYVVSLFIPSVLTVIQRFQEQASKDDISTGRFYMWQNAWELFTQKPLFGRGWRWFRYSSYTLVDYDVHNVFLQWLTEVGIVGSIPFFIFVITNIILAIRLMVYCRKNSNHIDNHIDVNATRYISVALMYEVFFLIMCATGTAFYQFECLFPYIICCAIAYFYSKKIKKMTL